MDWWKKLTAQQPAMVLDPKPEGAPGAAPPRFGIKIEMAREEIPKMRRTYTARLDGRAQAEITMRSSSYFGRSASGMLTQPGGRYVSFDPKAIAEKIIDPTLVPLVEEFSAAVFEADRQFLSASADQFTDEKGAVWRKS